MRAREPGIRAGLLAMAFGAGWAVTTLPAASDDYYQGKTIRILVGMDAGSGYDAYARLLARHLGRHLGGQPTIIVQNMPGAAGISAADHLYAIAPKDGTMFALVYPNTLVDPLTTNVQAADRTRQRYDPVKFEYIGTADSGTRLCYTIGTSKVKTLADARTTKAIMGSSARAAPGWDYAMFHNSLLGTKFDVVTGYKGPADQLLAMERGEIDGMCGIDVSTVRSLRPAWLGSDKAHFLTQAGLEPSEAMTKLGIASIWTYIAAADRAVAELIVSQQVFQRPYIAPPGTAERPLALLRAAFMSAHRDPELVQEAAKSSLSVDPKNGAEVSALVKRMYASPKELINRMTEVLRR